jgi:ubiquinone biosynthesis protein UbiJ
VFEKLDPKVLEQKLSQWLQQIMGSVLPRNYPHRWQKFARFLRSRERFKKLTFSDSLGERQRLVLGQVKVEDHSMKSQQFQPY